MIHNFNIWSVNVTTKHNQEAKLTNLLTPTEAFNTKSNCNILINIYPYTAQPIITSLCNGHNWKYNLLNKPSSHPSSNSKGHPPSTKKSTHPSFLLSWWASAKTTSPTLSIISRNSCKSSRSWNDGVRRTCDRKIEKVIYRRLCRERIIPKEQNDFGWAMTKDCLRVACLVFCLKIEHSWLVDWRLLAAWWTAWLIEWLVCWLPLVGLLVAIGWFVGCHWLVCWLPLVGWLIGWLDSVTAWLSGWLVDWLTLLICVFVATVPIRNGCWGYKYLRFRVTQNTKI